MLVDPFTVDKLRVNVVRVYVGSLMTSLEMAGVSLTLLHMVPALGWEELLGMCDHYDDYSLYIHSYTDSPTSACGWPNMFSASEATTCVESTILPTSTSRETNTCTIDRETQGIVEPTTGVGETLLIISLGII